VNDQPVKSGDVLAGKYRIERVLGTGAMGMVLAAIHVGLGTRVAVKVMMAGGTKGREAEERFMREARVAAVLRSQHAAKVLDVARTDSGAPYIVMEFLDGQDLAARVEQRSALPVEEAVGYILQACEAVGEAHALGIVHRDIKPANLFLTTGVDGAPCVKVVDFGIAKQHDGGVAVTQTSSVLGSPLYMSPEQMRATRDVDARADIWSLGVTLYQLLTGTVPFNGDTIMAVVTMVNMEPPTPITQYRPDLPGGLAGVIMQCLEKDPARRWPNIATLAAALAPYGPARLSSYVERIAAVQKVDLVPSRATAELRPEAQAAPLTPAPSASSSFTVSIASTGAPAAPVPAAPVPPAAGKGLLVAVGGVLALGVPIAIFVALRARTPEVSSPATASAPPIVAAESATTASASLPAVTASATALPAASSATAPPAPPSANPIVRPRGTPTASSQPNAPARPATTVWGGSRR
jgi:serine/threonine-protein kinase